MSLIGNFLQCLYVVEKFLLENFAEQFLLKVIVQTIAIYF